MHDDFKGAAFVILTAAVAICLIISVSFAGTYVYKKMTLESFERTVGELTADQKCLSFCEFQYWGNTLTKYKICAETCTHKLEEASLDG